MTQTLSKQDLLMKSLTEFYNKNDNIDIMLPIINGRSNISLRILDWFSTNYSKKKNVIFPLVDEKGHTNQYIVYMNYKSQLKAFSKKQFDPFCRRKRIRFNYDKSKHIITTIGQLNFFRWIIENKILDYIKANLKDIEQDMYISLKNSKKIDMKNSKKGKTKRRKRKEISVSATKSVSKHNVKIIVSFD